MQEKYFTIDEIKVKLEQYCIYQDRCHKEVEQKLKDFILHVQVKEEILLHLLEHKFLDEERFAKSFARGKFRIKKWGKKRIVRELKFRDISSYNIKTALQEIEDCEYVSTLYNLVEKKNSTIVEKNIFKRKKKILNHLIYKGYELDLIYKTIADVVG